MPKGKGGKPGTMEPLSAHDKIARLLGLLAVKDKPEPAEQVVLLQGAGFQQAEIASMLGITENNISVINYRLRNQKKRGKAAKKR
jgi:DNA-directed RNA polymerase specialized sigma24 family protein